MTTADVLATDTEGRFRVILEHDADADPGDGQGSGYVFYVDYSRRVDVVTVADEYDAQGAVIVRDRLTDALARFPGDLDTVARYFRTIGCQLDYFDTRDGRYVGIVTTGLEEAWGCEPGTGAPDLSEFQAREDGDVYGYVIEERADWTTNTIGGPREMTSWETVDDVDGSLWGLYGRDYAEETAREAFGHFLASIGAELAPEPVTDVA
jgi:hypothetical protein